MVVIGAGAAGLAAARVLGAADLHVAILEARARAGGRMLEARMPGGDGAAELGAEFIHGAAPATRALLGEEAVLPVLDESWVSADSVGLRKEESGSWDAADLFARARALPEDTSVADFLRAQREAGTSADGIEEARAFVEGFDAADPEIASALGIAIELGSGVDNRSGRPSKGYAPLVARLQSDCDRAGIPLRFSTRVSKIRCSADEVAVEAWCCDGPIVQRARAAILTLPAAVLRHRGDGEVVFDPALPALKLRALEHIETGHVVKIALCFKSALWEHLDDGKYENASFFRDRSGPFPTFWTQLPRRSTIVNAWAGGPKAVALLGMPAAARIELALDSFGALLGAREAVRAAFTGGLTHDWSADPFARGAYSYLSVGAGDARASLAAPVGHRMFFAGEACAGDGEGGTVNGALESGERAAREVLAALEART